MITLLDPSWPDIRPNVTAQHEAQRHGCPPILRRPGESEPCGSMAAFGWGTKWTRLGLGVGPTKVTQGLCPAWTVPYIVSSIYV